MERLKKIIENELKDLEVNERNLFRITSLMTFDKLINNVEKRMNNFEKNIFISDKKADVALATLGNDAGICGAAKMVL